MNSFYLNLLKVSLYEGFVFQGFTNSVSLPVSGILLSDFHPNESGLSNEMVLLLFSMFISLLFISERMRSNRIVQRKKEFLSDLFTKVCNELHTPFTVILGLSKQLREQNGLSENNLNSYLNAIERQGKNLSRLFNQLFDIADLQTSGKAIEWKTGNIVVFAEMVTETFRIYAKQRGVELFFFCDEAEIEGDFAPDYLHKILYNLLENAVKFSDEGSRISLLMGRDRRNRNKIIIKVTDQGMGVDKEMLPHIFDLFYKSSCANADIPAGNGIGLTIANQLARAVGGSIRVESEVGKKTTFTVRLPLRRDAKQLYGRWKPEKTILPPTAQMALQEEITEPVFCGSPGNDPRSTILLVENNKDIALYIRSIFRQKQYNIIYASNGEKAWEMVNQQITDLVITDLIMPKMNGIELCKKIKASPLLNHIPIIIISAREQKSDLVEGLRSGADSYIIKPFYPEELLVSVQNLLRTRQLLKEKYCRTLLKGDKAEPEEHSNTETNFLRHVTDIIYREMKNQELTPEKLARELAISVSQLNKKLNALTGYPSSAYILQVRLQHAKKILNTQDKAIGEVAAECGIYDVNYFSRIFKKHIGFTPTQFKRLPQH